MALPTLPDGTLITETQWNAHVTEINRLLDKPHARYYKTSDQEIASGAPPDAMCQFGAASDTHPEVTASGTNNDLFTLNRSGVWIVAASVRFAGNAGEGERYASIIDGADTSLRYSQDNTFPAAGSACVAPAITRRFSAGQTVQITVFQSSGNPLNVKSLFGEGTSVSFTWLCP